MKHASEASVLARPADGLRPRAAGEAGTTRTSPKYLRRAASPSKAACASSSAVGGASDAVGFTARTKAWRQRSTDSENWSSVANAKGAREQLVYLGRGLFLGVAGGLVFTALGLFAGGGRRGTANALAALERAALPSREC